jgi:hypothetical protein
MMLINTKINSVEYLNEVYFGKTNSIKNIENQIGIFRSKYLLHFKIVNALNIIYLIIYFFQE